MIVRYNYQDTCWWCRSPTDSKEHKYKKSDLIREFGKGPYFDNDNTVCVRDGKEVNFKGPNSKVVKFENNICQKCNNERGQEFDKAYDIFSNYLKNNEEKILTDRYFLFSNIYGANWTHKKENLKKYYIKHICCRLAEYGILVKQQVIDYLDSKIPLQYLNIFIEVRTDIVALINRLQGENIPDGNIWIGGLNGTENIFTGEQYMIESFLGYRWFRANWSYSMQIICSKDNFSVDKVILPEGYSIPPDVV